MYDDKKPFYNQMGYSDIRLERFWSKVDVKKLENGEDDLESCWNWIGAIGTDGCGRFYAKKKQIRSSRFIYQCFNGSIPEDLIVRHKCDNPACVNPYHLIIGTHIDNMKDMTNRNRQAKGSNNGDSILTECEVLEIKKLFGSNTSITIIAKKYNVHKGLIYSIRRGETWSHLTGIKKGDYGFINGKKLTEDQVLEIKYLFDIGIKTTEIADEFEVDVTTISKIRCGEDWSHLTGIKKGDYGFVNSSKLTKNQVLEIKELLNNSFSNDIIAKKFNVHQDTISKIRNGHHWSHITGIKKGDFEYEYINHGKPKKLNSINVLEIKEMLKNKVLKGLISKKFNISISTINSIQKGKTWSHITGIGLQ